ncbi:hypothetical protein BDF21DRAFT_70506 [Thamnidium elegans]|nr:hypothetical protein BDF21DRAFT_70506 [Thamnidium elegans]
MKLKKKREKKRKKGVIFYFFILFFFTPKKSHHKLSFCRKQVRNRVYGQVDQEVEEEEPLFYTEVDELQMHGIGVADITKLKTAGGVQMMTKKSLLKIKGLSETKVDKIKEAALKSQVKINTKFNNDKILTYK